MTKKRVVPEVRFRGFEGEWEERKLLDTVVKIIDFRGRTPKKLGFDWSNDGYLALSALNVKNGYIDATIDAHYGNQELYEVWMKGNALHAGQVLFTTEAPMGNVAQVPDNKKYILSQRVIAFEVDEQILAENFLAIILRIPKTYTQLYALASGGTAKGVSQRSLVEVKFFVPNYPKEQTRIGELFRNLDARITLEQRKHEKLQNIKKAMLEKMFPKLGAKVPEVRFKGFSGEWEERKLGEIADIVGGGTPSTSNPNYWNGDIDWYSPTEIGECVYADYSAKKITPLGLEKSAAKLLPANNTVLFTSRAGIGDMAILRNTAATNQGFQSLVLKDETDTYFIYSFGYLIKSYAEKNASGSTFLEIYGKVLASMPVLLPSYPEQIRIGEFFRNLDSLITLQQRKCEKLHNIKKAMLGKMFV